MKGITRTGLVLLTLLALGVRAIGIDFLLPHSLEPDFHMASQVHYLRTGEVPPNALELQKYPCLVPYLAVTLPDARAAERDPAPRSLAEHRADAARPLLQLRWIVALLSSLIVPATFLLARLFLPPGVALGAAALAGTSLLGVFLAQQARPHAAATPVFVLATVASARLARDGGWRAFALAGLGVGLALGTLQSGVAVAIPLAVAIVVRLVRDGRGALPRALLAVAVLGACVPIFYPYAFGLGFGSGGEGIGLVEGRVRQGGHELNLGLFNGRGFGRVGETFWRYDPLLSVLGLAGILYGLAARRGWRKVELAVVAAHAIPYLLVIGVYQRIFPRFALPLVPYAACLAAFALWRLHGWAGARSALARRCARLATALAFAAPLAFALRLVTLRAGPDTIEEATAWVETHLDPVRERVLQLPPLQLPLFPDEASLTSDLDGTARAQSFRSRMVALRLARSRRGRE